MTALYYLGQNIADLSLELDETLRSTLDQALHLAQDYLDRFANDSAFQHKMALVFGDDVNAERWRSTWQSADFSVLSNIDIRQADELNGALGAYSQDTDRIYISETLIEASQDNLNTLVAVLLEEAGHRLDAQVNTLDTPGDEGDYFSSLILGKMLGPEELATIRTEHDQATISPLMGAAGVQLVSQDIAIELSDPLITITGSAEWSIDETQASAIRYAPIQLWEDDAALFGLSDRFVGETILDENGNFEFQVPLSHLTGGDFSFGAPAEFFFIIRSESVGSSSYSYSIKDPDTNDVFQAGFDLGDLTPFLVNPATFNNLIEVTDPLKISYTTGGFLTSNNQAFSVFDALYTGFSSYQSMASFAGSETNIQLDTFLYEDDTFYDPNDKTLHLLPSDLEDWDVILHEFGHYISDLNNLENNPGDFHQPGQSNIGINIFDGETLIRTKSEGVRLAWDEGLATYLSLAFQHHAFEEGSLPSDIPNVSTGGIPDTVYTDVGPNSGRNDQLESNFLFLTQGEGDEATIYRILWDLADGANEASDEVQVTFGSGLGRETGHAALYQILDQGIAKGELDQIADVWNVLYSNPQYIQLPNIQLPPQTVAADNLKRAKVGELFEEHGIAPKLTQLPDNFIVEFAWDVGNRATTSAIPGQVLGNDSFDILIFDENFELYFFKSLNQDNVLQQGNLNPEWVIDPNTGTASWVPDLDDRATLKPGENYIVIAGNDTQVGTGSGNDYAPNEQTWNYWSGAHQFIIESIPGQDGDSDGIADDIEQFAGDGNSHGILDSQPANVASFQPLNSSSTAPESFITLASPQTTALSNVSTDSIGSLNTPQNVSFPLDFLNFTIEDSPVSSATQVELFLPEGATIDTYWKYDSRLGWYEFLYDGSTGAEFIDSDGDGDGESDRIILHFIDGGRGDADGVANGVIVDPGAPGLRKGGLNQAPVLNNAIADQTITANQSFSFTIPANTFSDPDPNDTLSYSLHIRRDLIQNGSFESGAVTDDFNFIPLNIGSTAINQWTVTRDQIDYYDNEWVAADGDRSLDLNGTPGVGGIAQTFVTEVGREYTVTFALAGHNSGLLQTLGISAAGQMETFAFQSSQDPNNLGWSQQSWQFTATEPETTLEFYSLQSAYPYGGPALDDVAVVVSDAPLPNWLTFDATTGTLSGTPTNDDVGTMQIEAIATDSSGQSVSDEFELAIVSSTTGRNDLLPGSPVPNPGIGSSSPIPFDSASTTRFTGTQTNDRLVGTTNSDILKGRNGHDSLFGKGGNDKLMGGQGRDRLSGGGGQDYLRGDDGRDTLLGSHGDDLLWGGNDPEKDHLKGGKGADTFVFKQLTAEADVILDFQPGQDLLDLSAILSKGRYSAYSGFEAFDQFVRLRQLGRHTTIQIDANGVSNGSREHSALEHVAILRRTDVDTIQSTDFVL